MYLVDKYSTILQLKRIFLVLCNLYRKMIFNAILIKWGKINYTSEFGTTLIVKLSGLMSLKSIMISLAH